MPRSSGISADSNGFTLGGPSPSPGPFNSGVCEGLGSGALHENEEIIRYILFHCLVAGGYPQVYSMFWINISKILFDARNPTPNQKKYTSEN